MSIPKTDNLCHNFFGGSMISEKRKFLGYTQEKMALLLNISLRQYIRIDKEICLPRTDILEKLICILNLSDEEIGQYVHEIIQKRA